MSGFLMQDTFYLKCLQSPLICYSIQQQAHDSWFLWWQGSNGTLVSPAEVQSIF